MLFKEINMKKFLKKAVENSRRENNKKIIRLLEKNVQAKLLDLGCDDGTWTMKLANRIGTEKVHGVEVVESRMKESRAKGIEVRGADLNGALPYQDESFDVVHANQIIEHLHDTDTFVEEIHRILKPGGYAVISTENLASWHNLFALFLGFQPFSMSHFSSKGNIGNPFSLWRGEINKTSNHGSWQHMRLFSYFGLKDLFQKFGFSVEKIQTSGYYPLFSWLTAVDPIHGHYIVYKIKK